MHKALTDNTCFEKKVVDFPAFKIEFMYRYNDSMTTEKKTRRRSNNNDQKRYRLYKRQQNKKQLKKYKNVKKNKCIDISSEKQVKSHMRVGRG